MATDLVDDVDAEGDVGEEDAPPGEELGEVAAEERPDGEANIDGGDVDPECPPPLLWWEDRGDHGDAGAVDHGAPHAFDEPEEDERKPRCRERREQG